MKIFFRGACGFQDDDVFIITGGKKTPTTVSQYGVEGFLKDLPSFTIGRSYHACGYYTNQDNKLVSFKNWDPRLLARFYIVKCHVKQF